MTVRKRLDKAGYTDVIAFTEPTYESAFLGVSYDGRAVYSYEKMVEYHMVCEGMTEEDAADYVGYNIINECMCTDSSPIVLYGLEGENANCTEEFSGAETV